MTDQDEDKSLDVLGVRPLARSVEKVTEGTIKGAEAFLSRICLPAAEELGLLLRDKVSNWRAANAVRIAMKAEGKLMPSGEPDGRLQAHPRLVAATIEFGSWSDDEEVQEMWAGLLASSCSEGAWDESNLIFTNLLAQLTTSEARVLSFACKNAPKNLTDSGLISAGVFSPELDVLLGVVGYDDIQRLDRELDHLRSLDLIGTGFNLGGDLTPILDPTPLALHMYARCEGARGSVVDFFGLAKE